jgi:hypothetical protein
MKRVVIAITLLFETIAKQPQRAPTREFDNQIVRCRDSCRGDNRPPDEGLKARYHRSIVVIWTLRGAERRICIEAPCATLDKDGKLTFELPQILGQERIFEGPSALDLPTEIERHMRA